MTMSTPFMEMPQRAEASPSITRSPPWAEAPAGLAGVAFHPHLARHHVLGNADAAMPDQ